MDKKKPIFIRDYKDYRRDFNLISQYLDQCVKYAEIQDPSIDREAYRAWMNEQLRKDGAFPLNNRKVRLIMKDENNDRHKAIITLNDYFNQVDKGDLRFAPTFTTYRPEWQQKSLESSFLQVGMANRSKEKKLKFQAKERGDDAAAQFHDAMQKRLKVLNNSSSGAKAPPGTILFNQTGHSTLTSICRSETSFANSTNEKFLGGYRHYFNADVVIQNILAVLTYCDETKTEAIMQKYQLHYVTPEELSKMIKRSTDIYWRAPLMTKRIDDFVNKLTPLQCSMYLYNSDFYMLKEFNDVFVREWMDKLLAYKNLSPLPLEEAKEWLDCMDSDLAALVVIYLSDLCNGKSVKTMLVENPENIPYAGAVVKNVIETFEYYRDLIEVFWRTDIMPMETAHVPHMMRGIVLGSDTDSSLFRLDDHWVKWYCGEILHNDTSRDLVATVIYIVSMHIAHVLGMMTGILNVAEEKKKIFSMKNEFMFSSFTPTSLGKHYFAKKEAQEGIMIAKDKMETEIKGVGLKHTKVPHNITEGFYTELENVMKAIDADEKISILDKAREVAKLEHSVYLSIKRGEPYYLQRTQIKVNEAYKGENNPYKRGYLLWEEVFADKYGHTTEPPYESIKVNIGTDTKTKFKKWTDSFEDRVLAEKLHAFVDRELEGRPIKTFFIPQEVARTSGIPEELMNAMEPRKMVYTIVAPYYLLSETFGVFMRNKKVTRLFSDDFPQYCIPERLIDLGSDEIEENYDESDD